jgi:hypothetical protein
MKNGKEWLGGKINQYSVSIIKWVTIFSAIAFVEPLFVA